MFDISLDAMTNASGIAVDGVTPAIVGMYDVPAHGTNFVLYRRAFPNENSIDRDPFAPLIYLFKEGVIVPTDEVPQI